VPRALSIVEYLDESRQVMVMLKKEVEKFPAPRASHSSQDEQLDGLYKFSKDRGTACCVTMEREYYDDLLLANNQTFEGLGSSIEIGLSHVKSYKRLPGVDRFSYLTRLYAVSSENPYQVVAMSALFCLNWQDDDWKDSTANLQIKDSTYDCPAVHFPTGMSVSASDPSKVIVAYGILDRQSRMVEYSKRELALHIFSAYPSRSDELH